jgi:glycosyltransferase involved in cell wall biosynthesis
VSQDVVDQFAGVRTEVSIQPSGVNFDLWGDLVATRDPQPGRILYVGRLAPKKGVADAIQAITLLDDVELRIAGDGPLERSLKEHAEATGVGDRVVFLGRKTRAEVAAEMRSAMCLVIPSVTARDGDRDGTPNVLGEAIASGVPVIASRIAGLSEHISDGETGLLHEPGDANGLAVRLRELLRDPRRGEALAAEARFRTRTRLDSSTASGRYVAWIRQAIRDSGST